MTGRCISGRWSLRNGIGLNELEFVIILAAAIIQVSNTIAQSQCLSKNAKFENFCCHASPKNTYSRHLTRVKRYKGRWKPTLLSVVLGNLQCWTFLPPLNCKFLSHKKQNETNIVETKNNGGDWFSVGLFLFLCTTAACVGSIWLLSFVLLAKQALAGAVALTDWWSVVKSQARPKTQQFGSKLSQLRAWGPYGRFPMLPGI